MGLQSLVINPPSSKGLSSGAQTPPRRRCCGHGVLDLLVVPLESGVSVPSLGLYRRLLSGYPTYLLGAVLI